MYKLGEPPAAQLKTAPCLHPGCGRTVSYGEGRGRRQLFCHDTHRKLYAERRARLVDEIGELDERISAGPPTRVARQLRARRSLLAWHLLRFPETRV